MMILLDGDWLSRPEYLSSLLSRGHGLRMSQAVAEDGLQGAALLVALDERDDLARVAATTRELGLPWIAWDLRGGSAREVFRHGAVAVLPPDTPPCELADVVTRSISKPDDAEDPEPQTSRFPAGNIIPTRHESTIIEVVSGIVGMRSYQERGPETLMGLFGPGDALTAQPSYPGWLIAWSSMQSRSQVEDRLHGILSLVAERFGERKGDWWDLDAVRMTHEQMAAAVRSTRSTVTRILFKMEQNGLIAYHDRDGNRSVLLRAS